MYCKKKKEIYKREAEGHQTFCISAYKRNPGLGSAIFLLAFE
jgi:hypothetical protein